MAGKIATYISLFIFRNMALVAMCLFFNIAYTQTTDSVPAPEQSVMKKYEDSLVIYADSMLRSFLPIDKAEYNEKFVKLLRIALEQPGSYNYPFDSLKTVIHILQPEDKRFRIFNWVIAPSDFHRRYYGAIQMNSKDLKLFPLYDHSGQLEEEGRGLASVSNKEWYGCEYYNIVKVPTQDADVYALFGYNNNAMYSKKKILDHLTFNETGNPVFGLPIIAVPGGIINRFILEYKKESIVNLNYNAEEKKIIFDRVASEVGDPKKRYTYVPVGQMDGFTWNGKEWQFISDAIPVLRLQDGQAPIDGVFQDR